MGKIYGFAKTGKLSEAVAAVQGGKKKGRGFWKEDSTVAVLKEYASGKCSMADATSLLEALPATILWYVKAKRISITRVEAEPVTEAEAPLEHGFVEEPEEPEDYIPF